MRAFRELATAVLIGCAALAAVGGIILLIWWGSGKIAPPCDGGDTGIQTYHGDTIECYHGDVVKVIRHG